MSSEHILKYVDKSIGQDNDKLLAIAKKVLNKELKPHWRINMRDEILAMKEKERLGFNFNRSVTSSLRSRWDVVEKTTMEFLQDIINMNDQVEEDFKKHKMNLMNLIFSRTTNLTSDSRVEQMAGLFMHLDFYKMVLEAKIQQYEPSRDFMVKGSELMGYIRPSQVMDRYVALKQVFKELYTDYECRQNKLKKLQEKLNEIKTETNHRNMLMHNTMAGLSEKLKSVKREVAQFEIGLNEQLQNATDTEMTLYHVKNSIFQAYSTIMIYRDLEPTDTDPFVQLNILETRMLNTLAVVSFIQQDTKHKISTKKKREKRLKAFYSRNDSVSTSFSGSETSEKSFDNYNFNKCSRFTDRNKNKSMGTSRPWQKRFLARSRLSADPSSLQQRKSGFGALPPIYENKLRRTFGRGRKLARSINEVKPVAESPVQMTLPYIEFDTSLKGPDLNAMNEDDDRLFGWSSQSELIDTDSELDKLTEINDADDCGGLSAKEKNIFRKGLEDMTQRRPDENSNRKVSPHVLDITEENLRKYDEQTERGDTAGVKMICDGEKNLPKQTRVKGENDSQTEIEVAADVNIPRTIRGEVERLPKLRRLQDDMKILKQNTQLNKRPNALDQKHDRGLQEGLNQNKNTRKEADFQRKNVLKCRPAKSDPKWSISTKGQGDAARSGQIQTKRPTGENDFKETGKQSLVKGPLPTSFPTKTNKKQKCMALDGPKGDVPNKAQDESCKGLPGLGRHREKMLDRKYIKNNYLAILADVKLRKTPLMQDREK